MRYPVGRLIKPVAKQLGQRRRGKWLCQWRVAPAKAAATRGPCWQQPARAFCASTRRSASLFDLLIAVTDWVLGCAVDGHFGSALVRLVRRSRGGSGSWVGHQRAPPVASTVAGVRWQVLQVRHRCAGSWMPQWASHSRLANDDATVAIRRTTPGLPMTSESQTCRQCRTSSQHVQPACRRVSARAATLQPRRPPTGRGRAGRCPR